jgi:hypothetical protein
MSYRGAIVVHVDLNAGQAQGIPDVRQDSRRVVRPWLVPGLIPWDCESGSAS